MRSRGTATGGSIGGTSVSKPSGVDLQAHLPDDHALADLKAKSADRAVGGQR